MTKIYLVEDHHIVRYGVKNLIELHPEFSIVGESESAEELLEVIDKHEIDLVISDISMQGMGGIALTAEIKRLTKGKTRVLILSMHADESYINQCFDAGANGYMLKDFKHADLKQAIDKIMKGERYISKSASQILANNYISKEYNNVTTSGEKISLTKREKEILLMISQGYRNKEIADKLFISSSTVDAHRYNILKKLEVKNTAELITKAIRLKLVVLQ